MRVLAPDAGWKTVAGSIALALLLLVTIVPGFALPSGEATVAAAKPVSHSAVVHPQVWQQLAAHGEAGVLLVMRHQADLSGARSLPSKAAKGRYVYEALIKTASESQRELLALLDEGQIDYRPFYVVNAVQVRADLPLVESLAALPGVDRIMPLPWLQGVHVAPDGSSPQPEPPEISPAEPATLGVEGGLSRVGADAVWALGHTGQGIVVAGQDTGYDWDHPALKAQYRGWDGASEDHDYNWHDSIHEDNPHTPAGNSCGYDSPIPCDDHGHGTHTMGTMVGSDGGTNEIGMAPGARWIGCRNMEQGWGTPATYLECFEFFLAPYPLAGASLDGDPGLAPHVVSNSWSCPPSEGCDQEILQGAVDALREAGIVVVVSAGNSGDSCGTVAEPPAIYRSAFTVGAFDHGTGEIAGFSSRGPAGYGAAPHTKPDIAAPGVSIRSSLRGGGYGSKSGTSMAAPHVAGAVALLLSAAPGYKGDADAIEDLLTKTAEPVLDGQCGDPEPPNDVWGWGIVDALAAVQQAGLGPVTYRSYFPWVPLAR